MNKPKVVSGIIGVSIWYILFCLSVDFLSKPNNTGISLKPIESLETYFFGFAFSMGTTGWILGSLFLFGFLAIFYFLGTWVYKQYFKRYR